MSEVTPKHAQHTPSGPHVNYLNRRETHTSRAVISVVVALLLLAALVYVVVEAVLSLIGREPLLVKPGTMGEYAATFGERVDNLIPASVIAVGAVIAIIGLYLILKAILPGPLRRHILRDQRMAVVVDDAVMAADAARKLRRENMLDQGQVTASVTRRGITAHITPTSGRPVNEGNVRSQLEAITQSWNTKPALHVNADIKDEGVVGR